MVPEQKSEREAGPGGNTKKPNHSTLILRDNRSHRVAISSISPKQHTVWGVFTRHPFCIFSYFNLKLTLLCPPFNTCMQMVNVTGCRQIIQANVIIATFLANWWDRMKWQQEVVITTINCNNMYTSSFVGISNHIAFRVFENLKFFLWNLRNIKIWKYQKFIMNNL